MKGRIDTVSPVNHAREITHQWHEDLVAESQTTRIRTNTDTHSDDLGQLRESTEQKDLTLDNSVPLDFRHETYNESISVLKKGKHKG